MQYKEGALGWVQLTMDPKEADLLERFIHLSAMNLMTWPIVAGQYMTERKAARERRTESSDPPAA